MSTPGNLIRDRMAQILADAGKPQLTRIAGQEEYRKLLRVKLIEEAMEAAEAASTAELIAELCDVEQVMADLRVELGISWATVEQARMAKYRERGGFSGRTVWLGPA